MDNEARLRWKRRQEVERLGIRRRQGTRRVLTIREIEVKPEPRDHIGASVRTAVIRSGRTVWPLQRDTKIHRVLCTQRGGDLCGTREGGLRHVEPLGAQPTFPLGIGMRGVGVRPREHEPAIVDVRVELRKEALDLGGVWLCRHSATP